MVTAADAPEPTEAQQDAERIIRTIVAGDTRGAVRRIILWVVLFVGVGLDVPMLTLGAAALLLATDDLV